MACAVFEDVMRMAKSTKVLLQDVIKKQLSKTSLDHITVTSIIEESGVNRKTLYYNYEDKYDLARSAVFSDLLACLEDNFLADTWETGMTGVLEYAIDNQAVFKNIARSSYSSRFRIDLEQLGAKQYVIFVNSILLRERPDTYAGSKEDYPLICDMARFFSVVVIAVITDWFQRGMQASPQELTEYLRVMFRYATTDAYDLRSVSEDDRLLSL